MTYSFSKYLKINYAKLPDEPPITNLENDPPSSTSAVRNNGPVPTVARKRSRVSTSKN